MDDGREGVNFAKKRKRREKERGGEDEEEVKIIWGELWSSSFSPDLSSSPSSLRPLPLFEFFSFSFALFFFLLPVIEMALNPFLLPSLLSISFSFAFLLLMTFIEMALNIVPELPFQRLRNINRDAPRITSRPGCATCHLVSIPFLHFRFLSFSFPLSFLMPLPHFFSLISLAHGIDTRLTYVQS